MYAAEKYCIKFLVLFADNSWNSISWRLEADVFLSLAKFFFFFFVYQDVLTQMLKMCVQFSCIPYIVGYACGMTYTM